MSSQHDTRFVCLHGSLHSKGFWWILSNLLRYLGGLRYRLSSSLSTLTSQILIGPPLKGFHRYRPAGFTHQWVEVALGKPVPWSAHGAVLKARIELQCLVPPSFQGGGITGFFLLMLGLMVDWIFCRSWDGEKLKGFTTWRKPWGLLSCFWMLIPILPKFSPSNVWFDGQSARQWTFVGIMLHTRISDN